MPLPDFWPSHIGRELWTPAETVVLWLVGVYGGEEVFIQICAPKKANGLSKHPGKLKEGRKAAILLRYCPSFSAFPLNSLYLTLRAELHWSSIWSTRSILHTKEEGVSKNLKTSSVYLNVCYLHSIPSGALQWRQCTPSSTLWHACVCECLACWEMATFCFFKDRAGLSIAQVLWRMLWHKQCRQAAPGVVTCVMSPKRAKSFNNLGSFSPRSHPIFLHQGFHLKKSYSRHFPCWATIPQWSRPHPHILTLFPPKRHQTACALCLWIWYD